MAAGVRIVYVRTPAVCFRMHIVLLSIRFYAKVLNSINFSQRVMGYLEIYRIFVPELRRSLHIAKYRNEQKSARFHIVTYIIQANAQVLDIQSKSNLERVSFFSPLYILSFHKNYYILILRKLLYNSFINNNATSHTFQCAKWH